MTFMGSKARHAKELLKIILARRQTGQYYVEPFVGGCNMIQHVAGARIAGDSHPYLIAMWQAIQKGWLPPHEVSEKLYREIRADKDWYDPALVGFVGFCCSYAGKWWGGYARSRKGQPRNYAAENARSIAKQIPLILDVEFYATPYDQLKFPPHSIIYCDPPYANTTKYYAKDFDHVMFWDWCFQQSDLGHQVFVSEYSAPAGLECVWEKRVNNTLVQSTGSKRGVERLFHVC